MQKEQVIILLPCTLSQQKSQVQTVRAFHFLSEFLIEHVKKAGFLSDQEICHLCRIMSPFFCIIFDASLIFSSNFLKVKKSKSHNNMLENRSTLMHVIEEVQTSISSSIFLIVYFKILDQDILLFSKKRGKESELARRPHDLNCRTVHVLSCKLRKSSETKVVGHYRYLRTFKTFSPCNKVIVLFSNAVKNAMQ